MSAFLHAQQSGRFQPKAIVTIVEVGYVVVLIKEVDTLMIIDPVFTVQNLVNLRGIFFMPT